MLEEIGKILKEEREKQGKSLMDVHNVTKISVHNLRAIEEGDIDSLPHPVYAKGFIKHYAEYLGLNGEELSKKFMEGLSFEDEFKKETTPFESKEKKRAFLLIILLICIIITVVVFLTARKLQHIPASLTYKSKTERKVESSTPPKNQNRGMKEKNLNNDNTHNVIKKDTESGLKEEPFASTDIKKNDLHKTTHHTLEIVAFEPCWMRLDIDGESKEYFLKQGDSLNLKFKEKLKVKLGNAGGVSLTYDGQKVPLEAKSGEVRIIAFP